MLAAYLRRPEGMIVWRISPLATLTIDREQGCAGGRWHNAGRPLFYAAGTAALAVAEFVVHCRDAPPPLSLASFQIPPDLTIDELPVGALPPGWRAPRSAACRSAGQAWLDRPMDDRGGVLRVPSAVVPLECNWLVDPLHPAAARIARHAISPLTIDARLLDPTQRADD